MSVRVIKNPEKIRVAALVLPEVNAAAAGVASGVSTFSYPSAANLQTVSADVQPTFHASSKQFGGFGENSLIGEVETNAMLQKAEAEAAAIVARAEAQAAIIEQAAAEKGLAEARRVVENEIAVRLEETRAQLGETIEAIASLYNDIAKRAENDLIELAFSIARKIVGREVAIEREIALALARVTLQRLHSRAVAAVHLHPEDYTYVLKHREQLDFNGTLELVEDRSISLGGCLIRTETGDLDARIEQQFDEISRGLLGN